MHVIEFWWKLFFLMINMIAVSNVVWHFRVLNEGYVFAYINCINILLFLIIIKGLAWELIKIRMAYSSRLYEVGKHNVLHGLKYVKNTLNSMSPRKLKKLVTALQSIKTGTRTGFKIVFICINIKTCHRAFSRLNNTMNWNSK